MCVCDFCRLRRRTKRTMRNGSHRQKNQLIDELANLYWDADEKLNHMNAIRAGDWPQSVEILERWLERAKATPSHEATTKELPTHE